jgi:hypothetical protein
MTIEHLSQMVTKGTLEAKIQLLKRLGLLKGTTPPNSDSFTRTPSFEEMQK